ncbi:ribonuclease H-like domain, reverse transcriptase, RNA-dependent DNA polymerase [Tanacetum coccineum]
MLILEDEVNHHCLMTTHEDVLVNKAIFNQENMLQVMQHMVFRQWSSDVDDYQQDDLEGSSGRFPRENGIARQLTEPYSPQQNCSVERERNWDSIINYEEYDESNEVSLKFLGGNSQTRDIHTQLAYAKITIPHLKKLDDRSIPMIYLGVEEGSKACRYLLFTRPDLSYSVGLLSRFMQDPKDHHLKAVKQVIRYIKGTKEHGIIYKKEGGCKITGYSDSSYGINTDQGKGTTGIVFYFGESPITWCTQKQPTVALSSCESEFMAATGAACSK